MRIAQISSAGVAFALLIGVQPVLAEEGWLDKLNPFARKEKPVTTIDSRYNVAKARPSPLEKLGAGTKRFFAGARGLLTGKKPAPTSRPTTQYAPWSQGIGDPPDRSGQKKKSWLGSLFRRKEPKRVESLKDWVGLPRLDP